MSSRHSTLQRLCPLSPWVGHWRPQILVPRLPMGPHSKHPVAGLRSPRLVLLLGAPKRDPSKIRERDGVLALGGHRLDVKRNNQPKFGVSGEGIIIEEMRSWRNVWRGRRIIVWGWQIEQQKIKKWNTLLPLDGQWLTTAHTTTNQKQASATEGSMERMCAGQEARGEVQYHYFGGVRSGEANKN